MIWAIIIGVVTIVLISVSVAYKAGTLGLSILIAGVSIALFMLNYSFNIPTYYDAKYSTTIAGKQIYFNEYKTRDLDMEIPSHYYSENIWSKQWKKCDILLVIRNYNYLTIDTQVAPIYYPYILSGLVECK